MCRDFDPGAGWIKYPEVRTILALSPKTNPCGKRDDMLGGIAQVRLVRGGHTLGVWYRLEEIEHRAEQRRTLFAPKRTPDIARCAPEEDPQPSVLDALRAALEPLGYSLVPKLG